MPRIPESVKSRIPESVKSLPATVKSRIPESVKSQVSNVSGVLKTRTSDTAAKLRQVDAAKAKTSAVSGASGAKEVFRLAVAYTKQETIDPIKGLGKYLAFGIAGATFIGFGLVLCLLSVLRALQTQTGDHLTGSWVWVPYLGAVGACIVTLVAIVLVFVRAGGKRAGN